MDRFLCLARRAPRLTLEAFNEQLLDRAQRSGCSRVLIADAEAREVSGETRSFDAVIDASGEAQIAEAITGLGSGPTLRVRTRRVKAYDRDWKEERTPGVVMVVAIHRLPALSPAAFEEYWREKHTPLALRHQVGVWDYWQFAVVGPASFDAVGMLGFPSDEVYARGMYDSKEGRDLILADSAKFADLSRMQSAILGEWVLR
jgi:hypothetical protein